MILEPHEEDSNTITWQQVHSDFLKKYGTQALFTMQVEPDPTNTSINRLFVNDLSIAPAQLF